MKDPKTHLTDLIWWTLLSTTTIEIPFQSQVFGHLKKAHGVENGAARYLYHGVCIMGFLVNAFSVHLSRILSKFSFWLLHWNATVNKGCIEVLQVYKVVQVKLHMFIISILSDEEYERKCRHHLLLWALVTHTNTHRPSLLSPIWAPQLSWNVLMAGGFLGKKATAFRETLKGRSRVYEWMYILYNLCVCVCVCFQSIFSYLQNTLYGGQCK